MSVQFENLIRYWRASVQDSAQHIEAETLNLFEVPLATVAAGNVPLEVSNQLWAEAQASIGVVAAKLRVVPVLVAPVVLMPAHVHGRSYEDAEGIQVPVWLSCQCNQTGQIRLSEKSRPQDSVIIDRAVIAPLASSIPTYAALDDVKAFLDGNALDLVKEHVVWDDVWNHVQTLFEKLFKSLPGDWPSGDMVNRGCFVAYGDRPLDTGAGIRAVYERLEVRDAGSSQLLSALLQKGDAIHVQQNAKCREAERFGHVAQMGARNPLNNGQRRALSAILAARDGNVVAVNGPPGTGKTTLLQSVVGSLWAQAAIEGGEPPIILASSTNNQAITNILDSFKGRYHSPRAPARR